MFLKKKQKQPYVYLDNAAATQMDPVVFAAMKPFFQEQFENPSALYAGARKARAAIEEARSKIAACLHAQPDTVHFVGSGTESINLAILGSTAGKKGHIITSAVEHHAVLSPLRELESQGYEVTYLTPDTNGLISVEQCKAALKEDTILVSLHYVNNETGAVQPIADIGRALLRHRKQFPNSGVAFHVDACQAPNFYTLDVEKLHVDFLSFNGSKIHGPKGVGVLYRRRDVPCVPQMFGGGQEMGLRSGTENVAGIVGIAEALSIADKEREENGKKVRELQTFFWEKIKSIQGVSLIGPPVSSERRAPHHLSVPFENVDAESLVLYLDAKGIACATGSACQTNKDESSHVMNALSYTEEEARGVVRFSLSKYTTKKDIVYVMQQLPALVQQIRESI